MNKKGFSLSELLVVIAIIVFAVIGINALKKVDSNEIKDKLNDYIEENI